MVLREATADDIGDDEAEDEFNGIAEQEVLEEGNYTNQRPTLGSTRYSNGKRRSRRLSQPGRSRRHGLGIHVGQISPSSETGDLIAKHSDHRQNSLVYGSRSRRSSRSSTKSVRFEGEELETPATVLAPANSEEEDDDDDFDPESTESDTSEGNKENIEPAFEGADEVGD